MNDYASDLVEKITKDSKTSFYYTFLFLGKEQRDAMNTIYSFCRISDDIVDDELPTDVKEKNLLEWEKDLKETEANNPKDPYFEKINTILKEFNIPYSHLFGLIKGMRMDLLQSSYPTFSDLRDYCYHAASVVGLMCIEIFGYTNKQAIEYAENLGIALQLTNIIRDVHADTLINRYYIPDEDFASFNYSKEELKNGIYNANFVEMMKFQSARAHEYYQKASELLPKTDKKTLLVSEMMHKIYFRLLQKIETGNFMVMNQKVSLKSSQKLGIASKEFIKSKLSF